MRFILNFLLAFLGTFGTIIAQDPQYSQYYAAPLYLNPAFTGSTEFARASVQYRNQWPNLPASMQNALLSYDRHYKQYHSGVGGTFLYNKLGSYSFAKIGASYSYYFYPNDNTKIRLGLGLDYIRQTAGWNNLVFGDQLNGELGQISNNSFDPTSNSVNSNSIAANLGGLLQKKNAWLGISGYQLNQPKLGSGFGHDKLQMKISIHGGYKVKLGRPRGLHQKLPERSYSPTFSFYHQGGFNQLSIGSYLTLEPIYLGVWYRGIPVLGSEKGFINQDAIAILIGVQTNGVKIGYSYDITVSKLTLNSGGAHELSISYEFGKQPGNVIIKGKTNKKAFAPEPKF